MDNTRKKSMTHTDVHQNIKEQLGRISELERKTMEANKVTKRKSSFWSRLFCRRALMCD